MIFSPGEQPVAVTTECGLCYTGKLEAVSKPRWAWLSDTHIRTDNTAELNGFRPAQQLSQVVQEVLACRPDAVLINGDLAWSDGEPGDYQHLRDLLQPVSTLTPLVFSVGNHDRRDNLQATFTGHHSTPVRLNAVVDQPPYRFIVLDSQISPLDVSGLLGTSQLHWLDRELDSEPSLLTLLFVHHPGESSSKGCKDFDSLLQLTEKHKQVQAIMTGHEHVFTLNQYSGIYLIGLPATGFPFSPEIPCGWIEACMDTGSLELTFHGSNGCISTHSQPWRLWDSAITS